MKNFKFIILIILAIISFSFTACYHEPTRSLRVFIIDSGTPKVQATDKDDTACKTYKFCGEFAYKVKIGDSMCYGPDYRVDIINDVNKRCYIWKRYYGE